MNRGTDPPRPAPRAWLATTPLGTRVVVRYLIEDGERATDVLGELVDRTESTLTVRTRHGDAVIDRPAIVAAKPVPPPPEPRQRRR